MRVAKKPEVKINKAAVRKLEKEIARKLPNPLALRGGDKNAEAADVQKQMKRSGTPVSRSEARKIAEEGHKGRK